MIFIHHLSKSAYSLEILGLQWSDIILSMSYDYKKNMIYKNKNSSFR